MNSEHFKVKKVVNCVTFLQNMHIQLTKYLQKTHKMQKKYYDKTHTLMKFNVRNRVFIKIQNINFYIFLTNSITNTQTCLK